MAKQSLVESFEDCYGVKLPTCREVCPECDGYGEYVHRDLSVVTQSDREDWADDDFMEGYMRGDYNVRCEECHGRNVVDVVDETQLDDDTRESWENWQKDYYETEAIYRMERAMGA
jgi:DnaJ-class molecular chaperone